MVNTWMVTIWSLSTVRGETCVIQNTDPTLVYTFIIKVELGSGQLDLCFCVTLSQLGESVVSFLWCACFCSSSLTCLSVFWQNYDCLISNAVKVKGNMWHLCTAMFKPFHEDVDQWCWSKRCCPRSRICSAWGNDTACSRHLWPQTDQDFLSMLCWTQWNKLQRSQAPSGSWCSVTLNYFTCSIFQVGPQKPVGQEFHTNTV